jgi:hypothetical protein
MAYISPCLSILVTLVVVVVVVVVVAAAAAAAEYSFSTRYDALYGFTDGRGN